jgi:uncharacterized protein YukE
MANKLAVNPNSLRALASNLNGIGSTLDDLHDGRSQCQDAVQSGAVASYDHFDSGAFTRAGDRLSGFLGDWSNGIAAIRKNIEKAAEALGIAADHYMDTDNQLSAALKPGAGQSP